MYHKYTVSYLIFQLAYKVKFNFFFALKKKKTFLYNFFLCFVGYFSFLFYLLVLCCFKFISTLTLSNIKLDIGYILIYTNYLKKNAPIKICEDNLCSNYVSLVKREAYTHL